MKKFVRGLYGRALMFVLTALMMVPSATLLSLLQASPVQAAAGGKQNIILLPITTTDTDAPFDLASRITRELQMMLIGQTGVEVNELTRQSPFLTRASKTMEEADFAKLMANYDAAVNPDTVADARVTAAGNLAAALGVDAVVYGSIDQYEFTRKPDPQCTYISLKAVKVTKEGAGRAMASPFMVIGKSRPLPDNGGTSAVHDGEAINNIARNLALQLTGGKPIVQPNTNEPVVSNPTTKEPTEPDLGSAKPKPSWWLPALGLVVVAAIAGGGGGGKAAAPPVVIVPGRAYSSPSANGVEFKMVKPDKFDQLVSFRIKRADRGLAGSRAVGRATPTDVVATVPIGDMFLQNNFLVFADGQRSTVPPVAGHIYEYALEAVYSDGSVTPYDVVNLSNADTTAVGPAVPAPVQSVTVTPVAGSIVNIHWELGTTLPSFVSGFVIERRLANGGIGDWVQDGAIVAANLTDAQRAVPATGNYQYRVYAVTAAGAYNPTQVVGTIQVVASKPQGPTGVDVTIVPRTGVTGALSLRVQWPVPSDTFVTGYKLYRTEQQKSATSGSITGPNSKSNGNGRDSATKSAGRGHVRDPRNAQPITRQVNWTLMKTIVLRGETSYVDDTVQDSFEYTYRVDAIAGAFTADPVISNPVRVNLLPGNVTGLTVTNPRGAVTLNWQTPAKNADGASNLTDGDAYQVWSSTTVPAGTATATAALLLQKFTKLTTLAWGATTYRDAAAPMRQAVYYVLVPVDAAGQSAPGPYPVVSLTPLPDVQTLTISPSELTVTLGAPAERITITAVGTDGQPVANADLVVDCRNGLLAKTADGAGAMASQQITTDATGKAVLYWKSVAAGEDFITANMMADGKAVGISNQAHIVIKQPVAETLTLTLSAEEVAAVKSTDPNVSLDSAKGSILTATAKLTDSKGVPVPGKRVTFACSDLNVGFPGADGISGNADDTNVAVTDQNGVASVKVRAGFKAGTVTIVAFVGILNKDATLRIVHGDPAAINMTLQTDRLPARDTSSTTGTVEVRDANGNVVPETVVLLTATMGSVSPIVATTGDDGKATFSLKATSLPEGQAQANVTVTAGVLSVEPPISIAVPVTYVGLFSNRIDLTSNVPAIVADNASQAVITAKVYDVFGQPVEDNTEVVFNVTGGGTFQGSSTRDIKVRTTGGVATVVLQGTPASQAVTLTVKATSGPVENTVSILMQPQSDVTKVIVTPNLTTLVVNGVNTTRINIQVTDNGVPVANAPVTISTTAGVLAQTNAITRPDGTVWGNDNQPGIAFTGPNKAQVVTITVTGKGVTGASQITVRGGLPSLIELSLAGPWSLLRTNGRAATGADWNSSVFARITDEYGNPVPDGTQVFFEIVEPGSYQYMAADDYLGNPYPAPGIPKPNTGKPYGSIDPVRATAGGSCTAIINSADRNAPAGGAEIIARVNRADGRIIYANTFRVAGPAAYQSRVLMVGGPVVGNPLNPKSYITINVPDTITVGTSMKIRVDLNDELGQPCAGNTPYTMSFIFTDDQSQALPPIAGRTTEVGGVEQIVTVTNLLGKSSRPFTVRFQVAQQLMEMPLDIFSDAITINAGTASGLTLTLDPVIDNTSATQIYAYPEPAGNGYLGPDQIRVVAGAIVDKYGNPVLTTAQDPTAKVTFMVGNGRMTPTFGSGAIEETTTLDVNIVPFVNGNALTSQATAYYRSRTPGAERIFALVGGTSAQTPIKVIGGAKSLKFDFDKAAVQMGADAGTNMDIAKATITALDVSGKAIPQADAVSVWLSSDQGALQNLPSTIALDANSKITGDFKAYAVGNPGPGNLQYDWKSGIYSQTDQDIFNLRVIGPPTTITFLNPPTIMNSTDVVTLWVRVTDVNGNPIIKDSMSVAFSLNNAGFVTVPDNGIVKIGDNGSASVQVKAADPTKVTNYNFRVTARMGNGTTASTANIAFLKPAKTINLSFTGATRLPTDADVHKAIDGKTEEVTVDINAKDDVGFPVPDGTPLSSLAVTGVNATFVNPATGLEIGNAPAGLTFTNGRVTLKLRGKGGVGGAATITATCGAATVTDNTSVTFVGPPAKITLVPRKASPGVVNSPVTIVATVLDSKDQPVFTGYALNVYTTGSAATVNGAANQSIVETNGTASFNVTGTVAGTVNIFADYDTVSGTIPYTFEGTGSMVFSYAPVAARIMSDGITSVLVTVNGYLPNTVIPVPDGNAVTITTDKGHFANGLKTVNGTFRNGVYQARLYGEANPVAGDLGAVALEATSLDIKVPGGAFFYGPTQTITLDDPTSLNVVINRPIDLTARLADLIGNPVDGQVAIKTTDAANKVVNANTNAVNGVAQFTVTPTTAGNYTVEATSNGKKATLVFSVNLSIPTTLTVAPVGVAANLARVTADGIGAPLEYTITATDAQNQPSGNFNATVKISPAGVLCLDQFDFSGAAQQIDVPIDGVTGKGSFWMNGAPGSQVGPATITVTGGTLNAVSTVRLIGPTKTLLFTPSGTRLLANDNDKLTFTVLARDEKNQTVMDGTPITLAALPVNAGDPPLAANEYRFTPATPKTVNGTASVDFYSSRIAIVKAGIDSGLYVRATMDGQGGLPVSKDVKVSAEGAQTLVLALVNGQPSRISADGISGPNGANQTQLVLTGTAVNSLGAQLVGAQLNGLPVTVTTQKGILNNQLATVTTRFDNAGNATLTLSGTTSTTPGASNVTGTSGDATSNTQAVAFVGTADAANGFTFVSNPAAVANKLKINQGASFTLDVTAKDVANPAQTVLKGSTFSITANGLTVTPTGGGGTDIVTTDDTGKVRWTITATTPGTHDIFVKADDVTSNVVFTVEVVPVAGDYSMLVKEEKKIYFDPATVANLPKSTSFELTGYQSVGGPVQPYAEITLTTDMGTFVATQGVTPQANGKIAKVVLNQAGTMLVRMTGDGANIGTPNITAVSGTVNAVTKALNTAAAPIVFVGPPYRIIAQAASKYQVTLSDDLRVMQDDPVTITASVQDKAGNTVLDGFMVDFRLPAGSKGILRARSTLISGGTVKADLSSNYSGVFVITAQAQDTTGADIAGVNDTTTVTIRTYARTITLDSTTPARISQDGQETSKITVQGVDANGDAVLAGTPARFTILQSDPLLAQLVDPLNEASFGAQQDVVFDKDGKAEIFVRGQGVVGKVGQAGVQVASYNTDKVPGPNANPIFQANITNQVSLYGPGSLAVDAPDLTAVMAPVKVVPGSTGSLTIGLKKNGIAYNPAWYTLTVTADTGTLTGAQVLTTNGATAGECPLSFTITAEEAVAKLASINPQIKVTVKVDGSEQVGAGTITKDFFFTIADKPWPGITDPATKYSVTAKTPATLLDPAPAGGLNLNTEGTLTIQLRDAAGQTLGQGRDITILSSDGFVGDDALGTPNAGTATVQTGTDGKITLRVKAPNQKPATGKMSLTFKDGASTLTQVDALGNAMASNLIDINVKDAKLVATLTLESIGATKRIYYSTKPEDTIYTKNAAGNYVLLPLPTTTTVKFKGMTNDAVPVGAAGATITVSTDRGVIRKNGTADAYAASKTYTLDAAGTLTLDIQGNGLDADLGTPRFTVTAPDSNVTSTFDANPLQIVGKANTVTVTPNLTAFFQNTETNVSVNVLDKAGQAVLDGWPVEFIQSSVQWADPTVAEWWETGGDGIYRLPVAPVTTNGVCAGQFASNHSGRYTVGVNVPKSFAPGAPPVPDFITSTQDVIVKTFARNYTVDMEAQYPTRILADGTEVTHVYVLCADNDNKKLLEGVKVAIRPNLGRVIQESDVNSFVDAPAANQGFGGAFLEMPVNQDSEIRFFVRGRNRIGTVGLQINNDIAQAPFIPNPPIPVPVYNWDTVSANVPGAPKVVLYGQPLATATYNIDLTPQTIAGTDTSNTVEANRIATYTLSITDQYGNPFPAGFRATIVDNGVKVDDPPITQTDLNGQLTLTHSLPLNGSTILKRQITIYLEGEGTGGSTNFTVSPRPGQPAQNLIVTKPISASLPASQVIGLGEALPFIAVVRDNDGNTVLDGFPMTLTQVGLITASIAQPSPITAVGGTVSGTLNPGNTVGKLTLRANYVNAGASTQIGTSGTIFVGYPTAAAVAVPATGQVVSSSTTAITANLTTGGQAVTGGLPVRVQITSGGGTFTGGVTTLDTTTNGNGQVLFTYIAPAIAAGGSSATTITVYDGPGLTTTGQVRTSINLTVVNIPATPGAPNVATGSKQVVVTWAAPLATPAVTTYMVQYRINGGAWLTVGPVAATTTTIANLTANDIVDARVSAINTVGQSAYSASGQGVAGP